MQKGKRDGMESKLGRDRAPAVALLFYVSSCRELGRWELGVGTGSQSGRRTWAASGAPGPATAWLACVMCRGSWPFPQFLRFWARHEPPHIRTCGRLSAHRCRNGEPGRNAAWVLGFLRSAMVATLASPTLVSPTLGVIFCVWRSFKYYTSMLAKKRKRYIEHGCTDYRFRDAGGQVPSSISSVMAAVITAPSSSCRCRGFSTQTRGWSRGWSRG
jgi:hypothetical protein